MAVRIDPLFDGTETVMRTTWRATLIAALPALLTLGTGATTIAAADPSPPGPQSRLAAAGGLEWSECGGGVQCSTLGVPADWRAPRGERMRLNLVRVPAADQERRLGSVVVNLGAGNSTQSVRGGLPPGLRGLHERFDLVVFDPPGLGISANGTLVRCPYTPASIYDLVKDPSPAAWRAHTATNERYDAACRKAAGASFAHTNSWQVAHDLDAMRAALGEPRLRYLGNSYGTAYWQAYAELFPQRVGPAYLDGVSDHTRPRLEDWLRTVAVTEERHLTRFRDWCDAHADCPLSGDDAAAVWDDVAARAERGPLPAPGLGRPVTLGELRRGMLIGMNPPYWPRLAQALAQARAGDAGDFVSVLREAPPEPYGSVQPAMLCHDYMPDMPGYGEVRGIEARIRKAAPRYGWLAVREELGRCAGIAGDPANPPRPFRTAGLPPLLIGIGELDNNTPNLGAQHLARQIPSARQLWHGDGHAAYLLGNTCLARHVTAYFTNGSLPTPDTHCPSELMAKIPARPN